VEDDRIRPSEVKIQKETVVDLDGLEEKVGTFTLAPGSVVSMDDARGEHVIGRLPAIERALLSDVTAAVEGKPGRALLKRPIKVQIAGADGGPGPKLRLDPGAVLEPAQITDTNVTINLPLLSGCMPWQDTDIIERAAPLWAELKQDLAARAQAQAEVGTSPKTGGDKPSGARPRGARSSGQRHPCGHHRGQSFHLQNLPDH
jgi:hypothetical protein